MNTEDLPCPNDDSNLNVTSGCLNYMKGPANGEIIADEFFLRTPSSISIANYVLFMLSLISFGLNPHVMQRVMAAEHDWQVRAVMMCLALTPYLCMLPGVFIGISYLSNVNSLESPLNLYPAFQSTLGLFQSLGGFHEFISYVAMLGAVAGIMSTADSALIGVSNTFVVDVFEHWLTPQLDPKYIVWIGKVVSFVTVAIAVGIAIHLESVSIETEEPVSYGMLLTVQQAILWQSFPAYVFGLYTSISWKSVLAGMSAGILLEIILMALVFGPSNPFIAADPLFEHLDASWSALCGVGLNLIVCAIAHLIFGRDTYDTPVSPRDEDEDDDDVVDVLSIDKIQSIVQGIDEPMTKYYGMCVILPAVYTLVSAFHMIGPIDPALIKKYGEEDVKHLFYNGYVQDVIGGFPVWAFGSMMWYAGATISGLYGIYLWNTDHVGVGDNNDIQMKEGKTLNSPNKYGYTNGVTAHDSDSD